MSEPEKQNATTEGGPIVDLNTASKKDLAALPGVGPDYAQNIIDARPFASKEQLLQKKVLPETTYNRIKDRITANGPKKQSLPANQQH